jgi:hypothetical protein
LNRKDKLTVSECEAVIHVERGKEVRPGIFEYSVGTMGICGTSSQPLLDACRQIQSILGDPCHRQAAIYRPGKEQPDMSCPVDVGARYRVSEESKGTIRFRKFERFDSSAFGGSAQHRPDEPAPPYGGHGSDIAGAGRHHFQQSKP